MELSYLIKLLNKNLIKVIVGWKYKNFNLSHPKIK